MTFFQKKKICPLEDIYKDKYKKKLSFDFIKYIRLQFVSVTKKRPNKEGPQMCDAGTRLGIYLTINLIINLYKSQINL